MGEQSNDTCIIYLYYSYKWAIATEGDRSIERDPDIVLSALCSSFLTNFAGSRSARGTFRVTILAGT